MLVPFSDRLEENVMPRGVLTVAATREEAEQQILEEAPHIQILRSREIDLRRPPAANQRAAPKTLGRGRPAPRSR